MNQLCCLNAMVLCALGEIKMKIESPSSQSWSILVINIYHVVRMLVLCTSSHCPIVGFWIPFYMWYRDRDWWGKLKWVILFFALYMTLSSLRVQTTPSTLCIDEEDVINFKDNANLGDPSMVVVSPGFSEISITNLIWRNYCTGCCWRSVSLHLPAVKVHFYLCGKTFWWRTRKVIHCYFVHKLCSNRRTLAYRRLCYLAIVLIPHSLR